MPAATVAAFAFDFDNAFREIFVDGYYRRVAKPVAEGVPLLNEQMETLLIGSGRCGGFELEGVEWIETHPAPAEGFQTVIAPVVAVR